MLNPHAYLFAMFYDAYVARSERAGLAHRRRTLLAHARGRVLEIGAGTGLNLAHYPEGLDELVLLEPEPAMARLLGQRVDKLGAVAKIVSASAESIPFDDGAFDTVVCTMVLCTVVDPATVLHEIRRVLRPGGQLLFLEHVRASDPKLAAWQDRLRGVWGWWAYGCQCNRSTEAALEGGPFVIDEITHGEIPKIARIVQPMITGRATVR